MDGWREVGEGLLVPPTMKLVGSSKYVVRSARGVSSYLISASILPRLLEEPGRSNFSSGSRMFMFVGMALSRHQLRSRYCAKR